MAGLLAAAVGAACRSGPDRRPYQPTLDQFAERYVRLTLRLALHQPSLVEAWRGPDDWIPPLREPVAGIRLGIIEAHTAIGDLRAEAEDDRLRYLQGQFAALAIAARRLAGESMGFSAEASASLGLEPRDLAADEKGMAAAREELESLLPGPGPLHERHAAFRRRVAVPPKRLLATFRAAVAACQARVASHVTLPPGESVEVEDETGSGLEALASYDGGFRTRVALDTSGPIDLAHLVWLAAHETYPGHHVQHVLADRDCIRERGWRERELFAVFGRHHLHAEGAADAGAALLLEGTSSMRCAGRSPRARASLTPAWRTASPCTARSPRWTALFRRSPGRISMERLAAKRRKSGWRPRLLSPIRQRFCR